MPEWLQWATLIVACLALLPSLFSNDAEAFDRIRDLEYTVAQLRARLGLDDDDE